MRSVVFGLKKLVDDKNLTTRGKLAFGKRGGEPPDVFGDVVVVFFKVKDRVYMHSQHLIGFVRG